MKKWRSSFLVGFSLLLINGVSQAGVKDDFIKAVKTSCGKSDGDAAALATPGRTGNVIKWKTCTSDSVDIGGGCKIPCKDAGSNIGG